MTILITQKEHIINKQNNLNNQNKKNKLIIAIISVSLISLLIGMYIFYNAEIPMRRTKMHSMPHNIKTPDIKVRERTIISNIDNKYVYDDTMSDIDYDSSLEDHVLERENASEEKKVEIEERYKAIKECCAEIEKISKDNKTSGIQTEIISQEINKGIKKKASEENVSKVEEEEEDIKLNEEDIRKEEEGIEVSEEDIRKVEEDFPNREYRISKHNRTNSIKREKFSKKTSIKLLESRIRKLMTWPINKDYDPYKPNMYEKFKEIKIGPLTELLLTEVEKSFTDLEKKVLDMDTYKLFRDKLIHLERKIKNIEYYINNSYIPTLAITEQAAFMPNIFNLLKDKYKDFTLSKFNKVKTSGYCIVNEDIAREEIIKFFALYLKSAPEDIQKTMKNTNLVEYYIAYVYRPLFNIVVLEYQIQNICQNFFQEYMSSIYEDSLHFYDLHYNVDILHVGADITIQNNYRYLSPSLPQSDDEKNKFIIELFVKPGRENDPQYEFISKAIYGMLEVYSLLKDIPKAQRDEYDMKKTAYILNSLYQHEKLKDIAEPTGIRIKVSEGIKTDLKTEYAASIIKNLTT